MMLKVRTAILLVIGRIVVVFMLPFPLTFTRVLCSCRRSASRFVKPCKEFLGSLMFSSLGAKDKAHDSCLSKVS